MLDSSSGLNGGINQTQSFNPMTLGSDVLSSDRLNPTVSPIRSSVVPFGKG
jgi:hypothetical protein